jgi:2,3-bisphosphoglycerate-dependent phosphoglycerate mutase
MSPNGSGPHSGSGPHNGAWPSALLLVRHGESAGNVARDAAEASGAALIDILERDMDVALSALGERQAQALGRWVADLGDERPTVALASPYLRACRTAEIALETAGLDLEVVHDERLREREFGVLDRVTYRGMTENFPEEAAARARLGKFYHRPPGGESWADVGLRVRSVLDSVTREHAGERVMIVAHQVVILMFRYVLERLTERDILDISRQEEILNCSITTFLHDPSLGRNGGMRLSRYNEAVALEEAGTEVTAEPDAEEVREAGPGGAR